MASIRTAGLAKNFGDLRAVNEIDLDLPEGGVAGFVGPNGAGKSTTIRMLLGALGAGGASLMIVDPASVLGAMAGMFTLIIFHFVVGWKVYRLSRDSAGSPEDRGYTENGVRADGDSNPSKYLDAVQQGR